jgi:hypothetical protein
VPATTTAIRKGLKVAWGVHSATWEGINEREWL